MAERDTNGLSSRFVSEMRRERLRSILSNWPAAAMAVALLCLYWIFALDQPLPEGEFETTIVGVVQAQSETPRPSRVVVEFQDGRRATIARSSKLLPEIGRKVIVQKFEGEMLGTVYFKFVRYADELDGEGG